MTISKMSASQRQEPAMPLRPCEIVCFSLISMQRHYCCAVLSRLLIGQYLEHVGGVQNRCMCARHRFSTQSANCAVKLSNLEIRGLDSRCNEHHLQIQRITEEYSTTRPVDKNMRLTCGLPQRQARCAMRFIASQTKGF